VGLAAAWLAAAGYPVAWAPTVVVCLAVAQWLALPTPQSHRVRSAAVGGAIVAGWLALHALLGIWIEAPTVPAPMAAVVVGTMLWFVALYVVQSAIAAWPRGALARSLYPWFYAGLYLDELMTRATFRIWPIRTDVVVAGRRSSAMGGTT
jgi:NAD(P)H-quinone oxidoreductase subunit 5